MDVVLVENCQGASDESLILDVWCGSVQIRQGRDLISLSVEEAEKLLTALDVILTEHEAGKEDEPLVIPDDLPEYV